MPGTKIAYKQLPKNVTTELLQKKFTTSFRSGYVDAEGCIMPEYFQMFGDRILDLKVRDDDVFVCSFPKCGTTWTQEMVWCIANDLDYDRAKDILLPERFPYLEYTAFFDSQKLLQNSSEIVFPEYVLDSVQYVDKLHERRFIKTHLPFQLLPLDLQNNRTPAKMIYVTRDPRDCMISLYHHRKIKGFDESFDDTLLDFIAGTVTYAPFWDHVLNYWNRRERNNMLFITYEELSTNISDVIQRVSEFLGKSLNSSQIDTLKEHLDINNFRKNKSVNYETIFEFRRKCGMKSGEGSLVRKGKCRGYVDVLSKTQIGEFTKWSNDILQGTDYPLLT